MGLSKSLAPLGVVIVAGLALGGCAWAGAAGLGALLAVVLLVAAGCSNEVLVEGGAAGAGGTGGDGGAGGLTGTGGTGGSTGQPTDCGDGICPAYMTCGSLAGEPWCFPDADEDGVTDDEDSCPYLKNPDQTDTDGDGWGDACDLCAEPNEQVSCGDSCCGDPDGDGLAGIYPYAFGPDEDNCPYLHNPDQADSDSDGVGDACDLCPLDFNPLSPCGDPCLDSDGDGITDEHYCGVDAWDSCPLTPAGQTGDADQDGEGDVCDPDGVPPAEQAAAVRAELRSRRLAILERLQRQGVLESATVRLATMRITGLRSA